MVERQFPSRTCRARVARSRRPGGRTHRESVAGSQHRHRCWLQLRMRLGARGCTGCRARAAPCGGCDGRACPLRKRRHRHRVRNRAGTGPTAWSVKPIWRPSGGSVVTGPRAKGRRWPLQRLPMIDVPRQGAERFLPSPQRCGGTHPWALRSTFPPRGAWLSWLERSLHTAEVMGSNPVAPTSLRRQEPRTDDLTFVTAKS